MHHWHTQQIDYVQAYPQAPMECEMYMELPEGLLSKMEIQKGITS
jgi:hypothetical protein